MVYFKVLLNDKRAKTDNIYPVAIRITYNRKNTTLNTGVRIKRQYWDDAAHGIKASTPNAQTLNKAVADFHSKVQNLAYQLVNEGQFSFDLLHERLNLTAKPMLSKVQTFKQYSEQLVAHMFASNQTGNAMIYQTAINRLLAYVNNDRLRFVDIDYTLLDGFRRKLLQDSIRQNSISNYFRTLRAIYNKAVKAKLVEKQHYPFLDISITTERTAKRAIAVDALQAIDKVVLKPHSQAWHARNYFLLSFALIGASFTDIAYLTPANINGGRIIYKRRKTGQELNIKLLPYTQELLNTYSGSNKKYLLPILPANAIEGSLHAKHTIMQAIKQTNKYLNKIANAANVEVKLTTYVARHTWATTAKRLGYSIELIAEALGHEHGNKITNIYLDSFDQDLIDEVNSRVVSILTT